MEKSLHYLIQAILCCAIQTWCLIFAAYFSSHKMWRKKIQIFLNKYSGNLVKDILKMRGIVGFSCSVCCCCCCSSFPGVIYCLHIHTLTHTYKNSHWTSSLLSALKLKIMCSWHFFPLPYMTAPHLWYETSSRQPFYFEESSLRGGFKVESHSSHCHKTRMLKETTRMQATRCLGWGKVFYNVKGCKSHSYWPEVIFSLTMFPPAPWSIFFYFILL